MFRFHEAAFQLHRGGQLLVLGGQQHVDEAKILDLLHARELAIGLVDDLPDEVADFLRLALYTGARINELAQLKLIDIVEDAGLWSISIQPTEDQDLGRSRQRSRQCVKGASAIRTIPLHPKLLEAGLKTVINAEYLEETPLGQAEWIKFTAAFFNAEDSAEREFNSIVSRYRRASALARSRDDRV